MKVLVVDDFSTQRKYIINILRDMGIEEFSEAANGIEAIERLRNDDEINIIILDWLMPHMDGLAFLKLIRAQADFMDIPVLFVTNVDQKKDIVEALKYNIDGYIVKPFKPAYLQEKVASILEKISQAAEIKNDDD